MSYKFSFADNTTYSAADINSITKRLVSSGIKDSFTDGVAHNVSRFNEAGKLLYTSGVVPEGCLTLKVISLSSGKVLINPGVAFFSDGAVIEIHEGGETLPFVEGTKNYIYLKNELADKNICYPYCGVEEPTGDCVLLAEIYEDGTIVDKRTYAKGKLMYQGVGGQVLHLNEKISIELAERDARSIPVDVSFDIGPNNFEYVVCVQFTPTGENVEHSLNYVYIWQLSDGAHMGGHIGQSYGEDSSGQFSRGFVAYSNVFRYYRLELYSITFTEEGILNIKGSYINEPGHFLPNILEIPLNLIFF